MPLGLFRVGRDSQNNLVLEDSSLSRTHFVIDLDANQAQLVDLGSSNGTYVNKKRVHRAWLKDGDQIQVGDQTLIFQAPGFVVDELHEELEPTYFKKTPGLFQVSWWMILMLLVVSVNLFLQLVNHERQLKQDLEIKRLGLVLEKSSEEKEATVDREPEKPEKKWQKALFDFKSGSEEEACAHIKALILELHPQDLLKAKAQSFYERKCIL